LHFGLTLSFYIASASSLSFGLQTTSQDFSVSPVIGAYVDTADVVLNISLMIISSNVKKHLYNGDNDDDNDDVQWLCISAYDVKIK